MKYHIEKNTVQETLIIPLFGRLVCSERFPRLFSDPEARRICDSLDYDFAEKRKKMESPAGLFGALEVAQRQYDLRCEVEAYLQDHPRAAVVNLGCGLDDTFRRADNGLCRGYNLDLPDVIAVRNELLPAGEREANLACDLNDFAWMDGIDASDGAVFFAAGVFYYFRTGDVRALFSAMAERFPGAVLAFDSCNERGAKLMRKTWLKEAGMQFTEFGKPDGKTLLLLPGTACTWQLNFKNVVEELAGKYHVIAVNYDGFEGDPAVLFTDVPTVTEKIENYILEKHGGRVDGAYGSSLGGSFVGLLIQRKRIHIDHGFIGSSDLDQGGKLTARLLTMIVGPMLSGACTSEKKRAKLKAKLQKKGAIGDGDRSLEFANDFIDRMKSLHPKTISREFYSDYITKLEDDIHADGTTVHIVYALQMGKKYGMRYRRHFREPDMGGMGILYTMMQGLLATLTDSAPLRRALPILLMVLAFLLISFLTHLQQYKNTYGLVYGEVKNMRISIAERLRKLPLGYFGKRDLADLTETIMGDVNRLEHVWSHCLGYLYGSYISTAVIAVMLFAYNWKLALACLWGVPVAFGLLFGSRKLTKRRSEITKAAAVTVSDGIQETLENIREIRATNQEDRFLQTLNNKIDAHEKTMLQGELAAGVFVNGASVIMRLGVATTILTGTKLILSGQIDFLVLFMFLLVITRIYAPFDQALALIAEMFMSQISAGRLMEIYDTGTAEGAEEFEPEGHDIVFEDVGFAYDNEQVLDGVSFTAKEGEVTALVGPSGSGKSTCARLAARLWDIDRGCIRVGGVDISSIDPETLLTDYSMVFQDVVLFDDTVMENIRLGRHGATDEEVRTAARAANCDEFVEKLPQGYATPIGENGARLSGGERQRISIARALLKDAPIVLLDEATASLDVENETRVQDALSRLLAGKTVLVIAHRMRTVEAADRIVVLADGKVAEEGSPAELLTEENGIFRRMTQLQRASANWSL